MTFIVAEMSASHCGSLKRAFDIVDAAKESGADAVKLQTWQEMAPAGITIESGPWAGRDMKELYDECALPWEWHEPIFAQCKRLGLECFSTPFDVPSVEFLETLGCPRYKVSSFEITDLPLIRHVASKGKPMILSTGMASLWEIEEALLACRPVRDITLLRCVSAYPALVYDFNLRSLVDLKYRAPKVGLSDHTKSWIVPVVAVSLGASVIERHLSIDREGPDGGFVSTPEEFKAMVDAVILAGQALGEVRYGPTESEAPSLALRRSLYVIRDSKAGERLTERNVGSRRPAKGMSPWRLADVMGRILKEDVKAGTPLCEALLA